MALIQINYVSKALQRTVPLQVILPVDKLTPDGKLPAEKKFKTLYLLHGFLGNYTDWVSGTRIQRWAEERDLCVVMPSGDNAFYVDRPQTGNCYGQFIGEELGEIGARGLALSLGFASGAMLYVVFGEILPQAILMYHSKLPAFSTIVGMLVGLFIIFF